MRDLDMALSTLPDIDRHPEHKMAAIKLDRNNLLNGNGWRSDSSDYSTLSDIIRFLKSRMRGLTCILVHLEHKYISFHGNETSNFHRPFGFSN